MVVGDGIVAAVKSAASSRGPAIEQRSGNRRGLATARLRAATTDSAANDKRLARPRRRSDPQQSRGEGAMRCEARRGVHFLLHFLLSFVLDSGLAG